MDFAQGAFFYFEPNW